MVIARWFKNCISVPDLFREGSVHVDSYLEQQVMCTAVVGSLCIYKTPLLITLGLTIYHHFLVVELSSVLDLQCEDLDNGRLLIRAEKKRRDDDGEKTGIIVKLVPSVEGNKVKEKHKVEDLRVSIPMSQLLKILTTHSPDYDPITDNCWQYADAACRALVEAFRDLRPGDRNRMNNLLQKFLALSCQHQLL